jgi:hypothetical protein
MRVLTVEVEIDDDLPDALTLIQMQIRHGFTSGVYPTWRITGEEQDSFTSAAQDEFLTDEEYVTKYGR